MKKRRFLFILLCFSMMVMAMLSIQVWAASYSGECGDNVTWELNTVTGVLTISGSGDMYDYSAFSTPWYSYRDDMKTVVINYGVTSIGNYAFYNCSNLTNIFMPTSITSIGEWVFLGCSSLTSITIPDSVTSIEVGTFEGCNSLTSITIPSSVTSIADRVFLGCSNLTSVTIPDSVTSIGSFAFSGCSSLTSITISDSVTSIEVGTFESCSRLITITVSPENQYYSSDEYGVLYNKDKTTLIYYPMGNTRTKFTIPNTVTEIGSYAFRSCSSLTSITIPDSVTSIGNRAFRNCSSLTSITIPDSVTEISWYAFENCSRLPSAYFMGDVPTNFGYSVFANTASTFTIYYIEGRVGWTSLTWTSPNGNVYNTATFIPANINTLELTENSIYEINDSGDVKYLEKVQPGTKLTDILSAFENNGIRVVNATGTVIDPTDTTTNIGTGYKVQLLDGDNNVVDEVIVVVKGEVTGDGVINSDDVIYLLRHTLLPTMYPVIGIADYTGDGLLNSDDAIYLLRHTLLPGIYPLN